VTNEELAVAAQQEFLANQYWSGKWKADNKNLYASIMAYINGGARPPDTVNHYGQGMILLEDLVRALTIVPPPPPPPNLGVSLPARLPLSSGGATFHVNPSSGSDSTGDGTAGKPWQSIGRAVDVVTTPGAIIEVADGTYNVTAQGSSGAGVRIVNKNFPGTMINPITIRAKNRWGVKIQKLTSNSGLYHAMYVQNSSGYRIEGIMVAKMMGQQGTDHPGARGGMVYSSRKIEFFGCLFEDIGGHVFEERGALDAPNQDIWWLNCVFRPSGTTPVAYDGTPSSDYAAGCDCTGDYYRTRGCHMLYLGQQEGSNYGLRYGSERSVVANCQFIGKTPGVCVNPHPQAREIYIVSNTFWGNDAPYYTIGSQNAGWAAGNGIILGNDGNSTPYTTNGARVVNNLFVTLRGHAARGDGAAMNNNLVFNNLAFNTKNGEGQQGRSSEAFEELWNGHVMFSETGGQKPSADPLFVDPKYVGGDFHLKTGSPAKGAAVPAYALPFDADGKPRSGTPSLGAYE
jgi:hypothetical protein